MTAELLIPPLAGFTFGAVLGAVAWEWWRTRQAKRDPKESDRARLARKVDRQMAEDAQSQPPR